MLVSRSYAKRQGYTLYYTGKPCPQGHVAERRVQNGGCVVCLKERHQEWMDRKGKEWHREHYLKNHEENKKYHREYNRKNREKVAKVGEQWRKNNPDKNSESSARYRGIKMNATPSWLTEDDRFILNEIYLASRLKTEATGVQHHVDHIVPLKNDSCCGLHVWWNLRVIPATENLMKHNSLNEALV